MATVILIFFFYLTASLSYSQLYSSKYYKVDVVLFLSVFYVGVLHNTSEHRIML